MDRPIHSRKLYDALNGAGLVPDHCKVIDAVIGVDMTVTVKYERYFTASEIRKLGKALVEGVKGLDEDPSTTV